MKSFISVHGKVEFIIKRENGTEYKTIDNLVVSGGLNICAERMLPTPSLSGPTHIAVGTDSTPPSSSQTALGNEIARASIVSYSRSANSLLLISVFGPGTAVGTLREAGLFNAAEAGTMIARVVFDGISKGYNDTLEIRWTLSFTS